MKIRMLPFLIASMLTLTVAVGTAAAQDSSFVPTATTIPCPMALPAGEVAGKTVTCGQISVPEDWDNVAGKQIAITYAILHSKSQAPFPDPVIYFDGGPGESSLEGIAFLSSVLGKLRATRDVILFDQRGALYSANLECPLPVELGKTLEQQADAVAAAVAAPTATEAPAVPVKMPESEEELYALYSTRGNVQDMLAVAPFLQDPGPETRCGEYFRANDVDLSKYDSVSNARDTLALLQALGYPEYNIYGISYGTRLATVVMRLYAEIQDAATLPVIHSVVIDGVMPTTLNQAAENPISEQYVALRVFADCEADAACGAAFPNLRQRAIDLLNQLDEAPIETSAGTTVTLADVTSMLTNLSSNHPRVAYLPLMVDELERGVDTTLQGLKSGALPPPAPPATAANPLDAIAGRATELSGLANQLESALNDLAQQTQSLTDAVLAQQSLPEYFLNEAERLALQRPKFAAQLVAQFPDLGKTAVSEPTRATIEAFIALYGDAQQRAILTSILNQMSDDDIRITAAVLATEQARQRFSHPLSNYMNHVVICNDSWGGLQDVKSFVDRFAATEAPQLIDSNWINIWQVVRYHQLCQSLQVTPAEMADQVQVASDIRTLVANGSLDALTPKEWGDLVYNSLTNAISTTIPYGGHGASVQTPCGQDMVVAFVTYPDAPLDTSCTEALQPQWVLPAPAAAPPPTAELVQLRANPWQWVAFASPEEQFKVETPLSYLLQFNDDATVNVVADCNNAVGSYQGEGGSLQIEPGPMTAAACPPDSRGDQFVRLLSGAALYFFQDGNLHIDLFADGGTLVFSPAPPDIFGDDGEGAIAELPDTLVATLGNLSYPGLFDDREIALTNGVFTETGDAGTIAVQLLDAFVAAGDLNGDGSTDAVALLELDASGSGRFTYLAPVLDVLTTPTVAPTIMVEDRIQPRALAIADGQVVFEYVGHGDGDGECCPSWNIRHTFAWQDGALVEASREEVSKVEAEPAGATAAGATAMDAVSEDDLALFQQAAQEASQRTGAHVQEVCPDASSRTFPLAEPDYDAKRPLDLRAFAEALAAFDPARAAEIDVLLTGKSIPDIQALLDDGELTSVELVTYYADRIQRYDVDRLNSVIELNPQVLAEAAAADAARSAGNILGQMHGIPVLLKDNIATGGGLHTTAGAYALKEWQLDRDAFLVQQLRDAGALILGKANLSEWANYMDPCMPSGFSAVGGQTRNPYGPYETYGSSSGSAVSVAANLATVAVGSETSGSMIQPARVNSVVGLRPSQGLISRDYVVPLGPHLDTTGPMGRSVTDVAILLNALKGVDANDPKTADAAALADVDFTQYLSLDEARKVRVGVIMPNKEVGDLLAAYQPALAASLGRAPTDAELQDVAESIILPLFGFNQPAALDALKAQGIEVVAIDDATLPWTNQDTAQPQLPYDFAAGVAAFFGEMEGAPITSLADVVAINDEDPANRAPYGQSYVAWSANNTLTAEEFARVQATAAALANTWMDTVLEQNDVDILVSGMLYSGNAGAAGVPALTIPNGLDPNGRPQGIILSGPYLSDPQLIAVGYALEQALDGRVEPDLNATIAQIDAVTGK